METSSGEIWRKKGVSKSRKFITKGFSWPIQPFSIRKHITQIDKAWHTETFTHRKVVEKFY